MLLCKLTHITDRWKAISIAYRLLRNTR